MVLEPLFSKGGQGGFAECCLTFLIATWYEVKASSRDELFEAVPHVPSGHPETMKRFFLFAPSPLRVGTFRDSTSRPLRPAEIISALNPERATMNHELLVTAFERQKTLSQYFLRPDIFSGTTLFVLKPVAEGEAILPGCPALCCLSFSN